MKTILPTSSRACRAEFPTFVVGLGSNLLVRDGGVPGVVIRLGRGFSKIEIEPDTACAPALPCPM